MASQDQSLSFALVENSKNWEEVHSQLLRNWYTSVDNAFDSIAQFFDITSETVDSLSRFQNNNLNRYFKCTGSVEADNTEKKKQSLAKTGGKSLADVAIITGGIGGIGTAICQRLSRDNTKIVVTYIGSEKEHAREWQQARLKEGMDVELFECDVSNFSACKKTARAIEKIHGRVDVLVNCAGITRDAMLKKLDELDWHAVMDTNLNSVFNMTRNFIDGMIERGYGRIINISSVNGQKGQFGQCNYSSAKAGMIGFSRALAVELAGFGITVNCICPGYVATNMVNAIPEHIKQTIIAQIPAGRLAEPAEIANAISFLAARESGYITGTELAVNGGLWTG